MSIVALLPRWVASAFLTKRLRLLTACQPTITTPNVCVQVRRLTLWKARRSLLVLVERANQQLNTSAAKEPLLRSMLSFAFPFNRFL